MSKLLALLLLGAACGAHAGDGPVVVSGSMPDQAGKDALLARLREVYGAARVVDQVTVGGVAAPAGWGERVARLVGPALRQVEGGQLVVEGSAVALRGNVPSEAVRQEVANSVAGALDASFTVSDGLRVSAREQAMLDAALANRIIEFESGSATLTDNGAALLDQMCEALRKLGNKRVEVIGHTDDAGSRASNLALSQARAEAVRTRIVACGMRPGAVLVSGEGPDRPVAANTTPEGRARNRRIEFRVLQ